MSGPASADFAPPLNTADVDTSGDLGLGPPPTSRGTEPQPGQPLRLPRSTEERLHPVSPLVAAIGRDGKRGPPPALSWREGSPTNAGNAPQLGRQL